MPEAPSQHQADRKVLLIHAAAFLAVNAVLAFINLSQEPAEGVARAIWFIWPLAGWGIGLAAHALALALKKNAHSHDGPPSLLQDSDVRAVAIHVFVYLAVNALLIVVNVTQTPQSFWVIWPLAGWGIGLGAHAFLVYRAVLRRTTEQYAREQLVLREMQVERLATAIASTVVQEEQETQEEMAQAAPAAPAKKKRTRKKPAATRKRTIPAKGRATKAATGKTGAKKKAAGGTKRKSPASSAKATAKSPAKKPASRRKRAAGKPAAQTAT